MKKLLICLLVLCMFVPSAFAKGKGWRSDDSEKYLSWWDRQYKGTDSAVIGGVLYQKEDYQVAVTELEKAIQSGSTDGRVYYQLGYSYQQLGNIDKAVEMYKKGIELMDQQDPTHRYDYYAKYNLALIYKDKGNDDEAIVLMKDATDKEKNEPAAYNLLGWLYWKKGNADLALEEYSKSIKLDQNQEDAQYNIGILYYNKGKTDESKEAFNKVLQLNPKHDKAASYLTHMGDKQFLGKAEFANLAIPDPSLRHCYLGKQNLDNKQYADAAIEYETALETNPKCIEAHQGLGVVYEYNDKGVRYGDGFKIDKSVFHYEKALALNPKLAEAVFNVGVLYSMKNRVNDAIRYYLRLIREDPNNAIAQYNLAVLYDNKTKNKERAVYHYTRYLKLDPQSTKRDEIEKRIKRLRID